MKKSIILGCMALCMVAFATLGCSKDEDEPRKNNHSQVEGDSIPVNRFIVKVAGNGDNATSNNTDDSISVSADGRFDYQLSEGSACVNG